ncbi:MAG: M15 family metallopeptidase [Hyphomonadaceae bacterium]
MSGWPIAFALSLALPLTACAHAPPPRPDGFVDAASVVPGMSLEMRYAGAHNFVGRRIDGYEAPVCILTREAAEALARVQADLAPRGLGLKVYDCYRPQRAVTHFARWAADLTDQSTKSEFYPNVDRSQLFTLGYIAQRSGHSRGSTVDLTIVDLASGAEIDMGSPFDLFDPRSWPTDESVSATARSNRMLLQGLMRDHGFRSLRQEWWHFTFEAEPHPDTYFDFVVR